MWLLLLMRSKEKKKITNTLGNSIYTTINKKYLASLFFEKFSCRGLVIKARWGKCWTLVVITECLSIDMTGNI